MSAVDLLDCQCRCELRKLLLRFTIVKQEKKPAQQSDCVWELWLGEIALSFRDMFVEDSDSIRSGICSMKNWSKSNNMCSVGFE
jgi:hypothetical protein